MIEDNQLKVQQDGYNFLREQMLFYHKRDFRVETVVKLFDRWGVLENFHNHREWKLVDQIPEHLLDQDSHEKHLQSQQQKLLEMVNLTKMEQGLKKHVVDYFELFLIQRKPIQMVFLLWVVT